MHTRSRRTLELSRAERAASKLNFRKDDESEAVEASRSNDLFGGAFALKNVLG